jgi:hypothetical protein
MFCDIMKVGKFAVETFTRLLRDGRKTFSAKAIHSLFSGFENGALPFMRRIFFGLWDMT